MTPPPDDTLAERDDLIAGDAGSGSDPADPLVRRRPRRISRRALLLSAGGLLGAGGALGAYARYVEPYWPAVEHVDMTFPDLPAALAGRRIVQLSDLHVADEISADYIREQFRKVPGLEPDLIVVTGDFITSSAAWHPRRLTELLRMLRAPLGVYAVTGNHDCGVHNPAEAFATAAISARLVRLATNAGIQMLRNTTAHVVVDGAVLQLVGVDDLWSGLANYAAAFARVDPALPTILLSHNPDTIDHVRGRAWQWMLCGHTHGGQVCVPFVGPLYVPVRHKQFDSGRFDVNGQSLYVNRGLGYLHPVRFDCRPEITVFTLRSA